MKNLLLKLFVPICLVVLLVSEQAAAFTPNDFDCAQQGGAGGTCFYEPCSSPGSGTTTTAPASTGTSTPIATSSSTPKNNESLGGVAGTGFTQSEIDKAKSAGHGSSFGGGSGFLATTYGPPWSALEGGGVTSTGLSLKGPDNSHGLPRYEIAVDPHVIPYGSLVTVWPNAVGWHGAFLAADTGGAIVGHHVDVYDWSGDGTKNSFSANNAKVEPYTGSTASGPAATNPSAPAASSEPSCCSSSTSTTTPAPAVSGTLDISQIVAKYNLQSAIIQEQGGGVIASYKSDQPPSTPASTMKLIIVDTLLRSGISLDKTVRVSSGLVYATGNPKDLKAGDTTTLSNAMQLTFEISSNTGANVLMQAMGGVTTFTQKAQAYGYTHTDVKGYYSPANDGINKSTIGDEADAMNHILSTSGSDYGTAQNALQYASQNDNYYKVNDAYNKWAGTSTVAGNVGDFKINGKDYIIGVYINGDDGSSKIQADVQNSSADLASAVQGSSDSQSGAASAGTSCCSSTNENVPAGTLPSFIPEPYNGAFTQGANNHNVAPALVAALFSEEHGLGGSETNPDTSTLPAAWARFVKGQPDPNSGWASSSSNAQGPFQFLPSTFTGLGYDISKINDLVTAADAAAKYAQSDGATKDKPESTWNSFIFSYNHASWYVTAVLKYYDYYNSQPASTPGPSTPVGTPASGASGCASGSAIQQQVVTIAQQELALWNSSKMSPGFRANLADSFSKYSQNRDELWCADFVSWVYNQAGSALQSPNYDISYVPNLQSAAQAGKQGLHWHTNGDGYTPQPGDIAIYGGAHTNILVSVSGSTTTYIGGDQAGPSFPDGSKVSTETGSGYYSNGITGYVSLN